MPHASGLHRCRGLGLAILFQAGSVEMRQDVKKTGGGDGAWGTTFGGRSTSPPHRIGTAGLKIALISINGTSAASGASVLHFKTVLLCLWGFYQEWDSI